MKYLLFFIFFIFTHNLFSQSKLSETQELIENELKGISRLDSISKVYGVELHGLTTIIRNDTITLIGQIVSPCEEYPNGKKVILEKRSLPKTNKK